MRSSHQWSQSSLFSLMTFNKLTENTPSSGKAVGSSAAATFLHPVFWTIDVLLLRFSVWGRTSGFTKTGLMLSMRPLGRYPHIPEMRGNRGRKKTHLSHGLFSSKKISKFGFSIWPFYTHNVSAEFKGHGTNFLKLLWKFYTWFSTYSGM